MSLKFDGYGDGREGSSAGGGGGGGGGGVFSLLLPRFQGVCAAPIETPSTGNEALIASVDLVDLFANSPLDPKILYPDNAYENVFWADVKSVLVEPNGGAYGFFTVWLTPWVYGRNPILIGDVQKRGEIWRFDLATRKLSFVAGNRALQGYTEGVGGNAIFNLPSSMGLSADGRTLYVLDNYNDMIRTVDLSTNNTAGFLRLTGNASAPSVGIEGFPIKQSSGIDPIRNSTVLDMYSRMVFDSIAGVFYVSTNESIVVIHAATKSINRTYSCLLEGKVGLALSGDRQSLAIADHAGSEERRGEIRILNLTAGGGGGGGGGGEIETLESESLGFPFNPWGIAWTSDGRYLFVGDAGAQKSVRLVRLTDDRRSVVNATDVIIHADQAQCIALDANDNTIIIGNVQKPEMRSYSQLLVARINATVLRAFGQNDSLSSPSPPSLPPSPSFPTANSGTVHNSGTAESSKSSESSNPNPNQPLRLPFLFHPSIAAVACLLSLAFLLLVG